MGAFTGLGFGLLLPHGLAGPPPAWAWPACLVAAAIFAPAARRHPAVRVAAATLLGMAWSLAAIDRALDGRIDSVHPSVSVIGVVTGLPTHRGDMLEFRLRPRFVDGSPWPGRGTVLVRWYRDARTVRPGETWRFALRLKPPRGRVNFAGGDSERWYFAEGITALGTVSGQGERLGFRARDAPVSHIRYLVRQRLDGVLSGHPGLGLVLALAIADRSRLDAALRDALVSTGTGHLLAISGLHVGMVALFAFALARCVAWAWPRRWPAVPARALGWGVAFAVATAYALLAGFGTSTRRALVMLAVWAACSLCRRSVAPFQAWWLALAVVLILDPLSPAEPGFWLSFGAVAVLIAVFAPRRPRPGPARALFTAQAAISVAMLPLGLYWFEQGAPAGLLVNIAAIPWVSMVNLPLVLTATAAEMCRLPMAEVVLFMAADASARLADGLRGAAALLDFTAVGTARPDPALVLLASAGALSLTLPRGWPGRWLGLWLWLPLMLPPDRSLARGELRLELLDVGQGLAAIVETRSRSLLYDSGPGRPGEWDLYDSVLAPSFAVRGGAPDWLLVSHGHLDHAGALDTLRRLHPDQHRLGNLPTPAVDVAPCHDGRYWRWDAVGFRVLHPSAWLPYQGNNSACVLAVTGAGGAILLPGDIEAVVERRLADTMPGNYRVVLAPHHGSRTSTTADWLDWAAPEAVLISAGAHNRFGFPHGDVVRRVATQGARAASTGDCGAIRVTIHADGALETASARRKRAAVWRWPATPECP